MPRKRRKSVCIEDYPELRQVVTLAEAARLVFRDRKTVRGAIDDGRLAADKCGRIWLISVRSLAQTFPIQNIPSA
jgi:hypothetical protein